MESELEDIVDSFRLQGIHVSGEEAKLIRERCIRKMELEKIEDRNRYLPQLFRDELKNHLFGREVNIYSGLLRNFG